MKYFRLHFFINYASGENGGCLYNMQTKKMIYITKENDAILQRAEQNEPINENELFLKKLYDKNMGSFYDTPVIIERTRLGVAKEYERVATPKIIVHHAFIQVTNECRGECIFCDTTENVYTKTRCKKWNNEDARLCVEQWENIFTDLRNLKCEKITFIGGDPLLEFEKICTYVELAQKAGIENFEIYTNLNKLNEAQIAFIAERHITVNVQIIELKDNSPYTKIAKGNVIYNIKCLLEKGIKVQASILITRYNDSELETIISDLKKTGISIIKLDFFYENMNNCHFSEKFKSEMYKRQFFEVDRANFAFLEKYNSCLYGKVSINLAGDVTPCPMMNDYKCGNVNEEELNVILSKSEYQNLIKMTRDKTGNCSLCAFKMNCIDCRAVERCATGKIDGVKYCEYAQQMERKV